MFSACGKNVFYIIDRHPAGSRWRGAGAGHGLAAERHALTDPTAWRPTPTAWRPTPTASRPDALRARTATPWRADRTPQSRSRKGGGRVERVANHAPQSRRRLDRRGAGLREILLPMSLPWLLPGSCSCSGSGPCLCSCPGSLLCRCHQGRAGVPMTAQQARGKADMGRPACGRAKAPLLGAHTTHPCGCVPRQCWRGFEPPTARFPLVGAIPAYPAPCLALSRLRLVGRVPLCGRDSR